MMVDEVQLKRLINTAVAETLVEQRDFLKEIVEEVIEDMALSRAIDIGLATETVQREEVFANLDRSQI